jgi:hypothetical protein
MGYGEATPQLVYGVEEMDWDSCITSDDLEPLDIEAFAIACSKGYAQGIVYGCTVTLAEHSTGAVFDGKDQVDRFAEKYASYFKSAKPDFFLCIRGDFEVRDYYDLDSDEEEQKAQK